MTKISRYIECALGILFLVSAGMKAMNVEGFGVAISAYGVIKDPSLVLFAAYATLALETALGAALVAGWRGRSLSFIGSILLTAVFSGLITYAWKVNGLEDCGCFGDYLKMTPPQSLTKNAVIIALLLLAWVGLRNAQDVEFRPRIKVQLCGILGAIIVTCIVFTHNTPRASVSAPADPTAAAKDIAFVLPSGDETIDLGTGNYLVAFLNTECEHCKESVPGLNALAADESLPDFIAVMMGDDEKLIDFILETEPAFPTELIDTLSFMEHILIAPPILYYIEDGMKIHHWEWEDEPPAPGEIAHDIAAQKD